MPVSNYRDHIDVGGRKFGEKSMHFDGEDYYFDSSSHTSESLRFAEEGGVIYLGVSSYKDAYSLWIATTLRGIIENMLKGNSKKCTFQVGIIDMGNTVGVDDINPIDLYFSKRGATLYNLVRGTTLYNVVRGGEYSITNAGWSDQAFHPVKGDSFEIERWRELRLSKVRHLPISIDNEEVILYTKDGVTSMRIDDISDCGISYTIMDTGIDKYDKYLKEAIRKSEVDLYYPSEGESVGVGEIL